jgi:hypothetical protein
MKQADTVQEDWLTILNEGARLLEAGQIEEAAQVLGGLGPLCAPGAPKPTEAVALQARELLQRCYRAEAQQRAKVVDELNQLASGHRARAYRGPAEQAR